MKIHIILLLTAAQAVFGIIYRLNESEYARFPKLFRLDNYDDCLIQPGGKYCYVDGEILGGDSDLHKLIKDYSDSVLTHFNHSLIHWGLCVTQTCRQYYGNSTLEDTLDACINASLFESHQLQGKLIRENMYCTDSGEVTPYDASDYVVATIFAILLTLNVLGTACDLFCTSQHGFFSRLLLCFSVKRSWQKLVMPSGEGPEPKLKSLKCLNGIKAMTTFLVLLGHSPLSAFIAIDNPLHQEESYHKPFFQILLNGTLIVQVFFLISGFLLSYNILVMSEKRRMGWQTIPQGIFLRWLRLTPVYALIIAFVSTWVRHLASGPLWKPVVDLEVTHCRRDWWLHLLYIDNYVDLSQCMPQSWYISSDMQLTILGLVIFCLCQSKRSRRIAIGIAFVIGLLTPAAHTFIQDLHAVLIVSPEMARNFFVHDLTFNNLYKRGHTNLVNYALGMGLGMLMYDMYGQDHTKNKKKHRLLYWATIPMGLASIMLGMMFYVDGIQIPLLVRSVYSSAIKLCFGGIVAAFIVGTLMKLDTVYRGIVEWRGWAPVGRISYCAYLIHVCVIRTTSAYFTSLQHVSIYHTLMNYYGVVGATYMLAAPCWLLLECPLAQFIKFILEGGRSKKQDLTIKVAPPKWNDHELSNSVETVVVKTNL